MAFRFTDRRLRSVGLTNALAPTVLFLSSTSSVKPSSLASQASRLRYVPKRVTPLFKSSATTDVLKVNIRSAASPLMKAKFDPISHVFNIGSFVITFTVPAIAFEPYRAEPPLRTTSILSIIFIGICSRPYTPNKEENTGLLFNKTCV